MQNKAGYWMVARDFTGKAKMGWATQEEKTVDPAMEEAIAIKAALSLVKQGGWRRIQIQSDCKAIIEKLNDNHIEVLKLANVLEDILVEKN